MTVDESELSHPIGQEDIHFIPVITGAGRGFGKILLGAALIGACICNRWCKFFNVTSGLDFSKAGFRWCFLNKAITYVGAYLVLSGVSEMLFPYLNLLNLNQKKILDYHLVLVERNRQEEQELLFL